MAGEKKSSGKADPLMVQSVAKAFTILEAFDTQNHSMTLSQIAAKTGLDVSAVQRFTHTLATLGYLTKDPVNRRFELSIKVLDMAHHYTRSSRLVTRAMPALLQLSKETEETVNLTVLDGTDVVYIFRLMSRNVLSPGVISGTHIPAYCSSPGRAILSRLPREEAEAVVARSDLAAHTVATITDPARIMDRIEAARQNGFEACFEELFHGDASIAAPIIDPGGRAIGAVSIATMLSRFSRDEVLKRYAPLVVDAARSISQN